jgi:3'' terminal RNA ribose 2''-O-methyltransferase Hen1
MLLTITTTHRPATDLGYLLHKNPARSQTFPLSFGQAHVFYPEATPERCTAALLLDVDAVGLVRGGGPGAPRTLAQYVNDRPYVASSFLSVALAGVFGSALNGRTKEKQELAETPLPLEATLSVVPSRGGEAFLRRLFEPLGYAVEAESHALDATFPEWDESPYFTVRLSGTVRLADLLTHLYVLIPTLDAGKHYAIGDDEVEKLLRRGEGWLASHPEKDAIVRRYLKHRRSLVRDALAQLTQEEVPEAADEAEEQRGDAAEAAVERPLSLHDQRLGAVLAVLKQSEARRVLDLGCGEGRLLEMLLKDGQFTEVVGMDVSYRALERAQERLRLDRLPPAVRERVRLMQGSLIYRDRRLENFDAAAVVEVIEHLDPPRLAAFERVVFGFARPKSVVVTTPNVEYNVRFPSLPAGKFRHPDHRFEWTRAEFQAWAGAIADRYGYTARFLPLGPEDPEVGAPSQMAVLDRA